MAVRINLFLSTFTLAVIFSASAVLEGPNVCVRQETYTVIVNTSEQKPIKERQNTWCFSWPPRCSSYRAKFKTEYKQQTLTKQRPVAECCKGYGETSSGDRCVPVCSQDCKHGTCIAPDQCICELGYGGQSCDKKCSQGKWGPKCIRDCDCPNDGNCDPLDGKCECTENCLETYPSSNRKVICDCKNDNYVCHPTDGCICMHGYTGPNCEEPLYSLNILEQKSETNYTGFHVALVFSLCIVIAMMIAGLMYHRRKVADLKMEIGHVQYIAEPVVTPDQNHFDNPVYSYQSSDKPDDGSVNLLNNSVIRNNLGMKSVNSEKAKLESLGSVEEDNASCKGTLNIQHSHMASVKNKDADHGNPNINVYHSIDEIDSKKIINEPLYDEIKQNNGDFVYDHLDYTRSVSAWKPHYQRMSNGFSPEKDGSGSGKSNQHDPELGDS